MKPRKQILAVCIALSLSGAAPGTGSYVLLARTGNATAPTQAAPPAAGKSLRQSPSIYRIMIPDLKAAREQDLGNCWYHSHARASEYVYQRLTGHRINFSPNYLSANYMRAKALEALGNPSLPTQSIDASSWGSPSELQMRYGLMTTTRGLTSRKIERLRKGLEEAVEEFRKESGADHSSETSRHLMERYWDKVNRLADNAGASAEQKFRIAGQEYTPINLAKSYPFDRLKWVIVQVGDRHRYLPNLPMVSSYQDVIGATRSFGRHKLAGPKVLIGKRHHHLLLKTDPARSPSESIVIPNAEFSDFFGFLIKSKSSLESLIRNALSTGLPIMACSLITNYYTASRKIGLKITGARPAAPLTWYEDDHGMVIVGMERFASGKVLVYLQNSWGPSALGYQGLVAAPLQDLARLLNRLAFPVIGPKT